MKVRLQKNADIDAVDDLIKNTYKSESHSHFVTELRSSGAPLISVIAEEDGNVMAQALFAPVTLNNKLVKWFSLVSISVREEYQQLGVATALLSHGMETCEGMGIEAVLSLEKGKLLLNADFETAKTHGLSSVLECNDNVLVVKFFTKRDDRVGEVGFHPLYNQYFKTLT